jgi:hypothetical protein
MVIYSGGSKISTLMWLVWVAVILSVSGGGLGLFRLLRHAGLAPSSSLPTTCGDINSEVYVKGKTFDGAGPVIQTGMNCKIILEDCTITSSDAIIKGSGMNVEVTIRNSKLTSKRTAIELEMNGKVRVESGSVVKGGDVAVEGASNLSLTVSNATLEGDIATKAGSNAQITLQQGSVLKGRKAAIEAGSSLKVRADGATLESGGPAIKGGGSGDVKMDAQCKITASPPFAFSGGAQIDVPPSVAAPKGAVPKPAPSRK